MTDRYQYTLALRALREVQAEIEPAPVQGQLIFPGAVDAFESIGRLPSGAVLFGIAADGLPLLLHLRDPRPGPILVVGDQGSGKTDFLKTMVKTSALLSARKNIHFVALTDFPDEWNGFDEPDVFSGAYPAYDPATANLLRQMAYQAQERQNRNPLVLLFDGLDSILHMDVEAQRDLDTLLAYGPQAMIWPIVAVNSERIVKMQDWLACFRTRIYGRITNPATAEELTPVPGAPLSGLFPGSQFCIRERSNWLKFWVLNMPL